MNAETKKYYTLARMYEYVRDIRSICDSKNGNLDAVISDPITKHAVNMCFLQLGELAGKLRDIDKDFYLNSEIPFSLIKGMRDRIAHTYTNIDYGTISKVLSISVPELERYLQKTILPEVIENPYILFEREYEELIAEDKLSERKPLKDLMTDARSRAGISNTKTASHKITEAVIE